MYSDHFLSTRNQSIHESHKLRYLTQWVAQEIMVDVLIDNGLSIKCTKLSIKNQSNAAWGQPKAQNCARPVLEMILWLMQLCNCGQDLSALPQGFADDWHQ